MELFGTAGIRGSAVDTVTPERALAVGQAVAKEAGTDDIDPTVAIGRDGRLSGPALGDAVAAGVQSAGATALRLGEVPTPVVGFASRGRHAIAVTASHNPPEDNGLKLFVDGVEYGEAAEERIASRVAEDPGPTHWADWATAVDHDPLDEYREAVIEFVGRYGEGLADQRIVVDCGNGVASSTTPPVLRALGAKVVTLHGNIDGRFSGRESKPTPETLTDLQAFLADDDEASLGIAHDGDGDRVVVVDGGGEIVHEDTVLAILAHHCVSRSQVPDPVVVTTPNASGRVDERVRAAGGRIERAPLGAVHEGIAAVERSGGRVVFAGEPWKHIHPRLGGWIDGTVTAAILARLVAASGLDRLREPVRERPYRKLSLDCPDDAKPDAMTTLEARLPAAIEAAEVSTANGVRVTRPDGSWVLVRASGTEPKLRIYAESEHVDSLLTTVREVVADAIADARG